MEAPERKEGNPLMRGDRKKNHRINKMQKQIRKI